MTDKAMLTIGLDTFELPIIKGTTGPDVVDVRNDGKLVLVQCTLLETSAMVCRINMFPNAAERYIHNHSAPFASVALHGEYVHQTWRVDTTQRDASFTCIVTP